MGVMLMVPGFFVLLAGCAVAFMLQGTAPVLWPFYLVLRWFHMPDYTILPLASLGVMAVGAIAGIIVRRHLGTR